MGRHSAISVRLRRFLPMPPLRPAPCIQTALKNHVYYSDRAKMWAAKTVELTEAGEYQKAKAAQRKCSYWLARAMRLEQR